MKCGHYSVDSSILVHTGSVNQSFPTHLLALSQSLLAWLAPFILSSGENQRKYCHRHLACALDMIELLAPAFAEEGSQEGMADFSDALQGLVGQPDGEWADGGLWGRGVTASRLLPMDTMSSFGLFPAKDVAADRQGEAGF